MSLEIMWFKLPFHKQRKKNWNKEFVMLSVELVTESDLKQQELSIQAQNYCYMV